MEIKPVFVEEIDTNCVLARDLYSYLFPGDARNSNYSRWFSTQAQLFELNSDYIKFKVEQENLKSKGKPPTEHLISFDMAKHICLLSRTKVGHQYRADLIAIEKRQRNPTEFTKNLQNMQATVRKLELTLNTTKHERDAFAKRINLMRQLMEDNMASTVIPEGSGATVPITFLHTYLQSTEHDELTMDEVVDLLVDNHIVQRSERGLMPTLESGDGNVFINKTDKVVNFTAKGMFSTLAAIRNDVIKRKIEQMMM